MIGKGIHIVSKMIIYHQVLKKIQEISAEGESMTREHENHEMFGQDQDEQLLLWINRLEHYNLFHLE